MSQGQINRGSKLGELIYDLCKQDDIKTIVEIGTWNGLGTTKCIHDSIVENNKKEYEVYSIESNEKYYNMAINNLSKLKNFNIILGRIIEVEDLLDINNSEDKFFNLYDKKTQNTWLVEDVNNYKNIPNILNILPENIDLLILDGGEFSSLSEYNILKDRCKYFVLDDTNVLKNHEVANIMRNNKNYEILHDEINDRNGFLISKKND